MTESGDPHENHFFDEWDLDESDIEPLPRPRWRRPALIVVAVITAVALAAVPLYNVFFARSVAVNGLEVCGFDYCIVQEAVRDAGLGFTMSRLSHTFLDESEARALDDDLTAYLGINPVRLQVVEDLGGHLGGVYDQSSRSITIESPARAWTVLHEVAHAMEGGHGADFQEVVIDLATYLEKGAS